MVGKISRGAADPLPFSEFGSTEIGVVSVELLELVEGNFTFVRQSPAIITTLYLDVPAGTICICLWHGDVTAIAANEIARHEVVAKGGAGIHCEEILLGDAASFSEFGTGIARRHLDSGALCTRTQHWAGRARRPIPENSWGCSILTKSETGISSIQEGFSRTDHARHHPQREVAHFKLGLKAGDALGMVLQID